MTPGSNACRAIVLALVVGSTPAVAGEADAGASAVCALIADAAGAQGLPLPYFTRLIWRESRFHSDARSPAGAQGVAQFMPGTAADRGLADPFATKEALSESAAYLAELRGLFGNLGLAAAAYNAGPGRVGRWLAGQADLPQETLDYVVAVTGHAAVDWRARPPPALPDDKDFSCARYAALAGSAPVRAADPSLPTLGKGWAVILVGNPERDKVVAEYAIVKGQYAKILGGVPASVVHKRISGLRTARYIVQIERDTHAAATALCSRLLRAGGACFVLANGS